AELALDGSAVTAGAEGEASDLDTRLAEGNPVGGFGTVREQGQGSGGCERAGDEGGLEEITSGIVSHGASMGRAVSELVETSIQHRGRCVPGSRRAGSDAGLAEGGTPSGGGGL